MILTLIAANKKEISAPEKSTNDRHVMTPLSFRHFPSGKFAETRVMFLLGKRLRSTPLFPKSGIPEPLVPSLVELLLHRHRTAPYCDIQNDSFSSKCLHRRVTDLESKVEDLPLGKMLEENVPFYHHFIKDRGHRFKFRGPSLPGPKVMYLTSATLVVVPSNLMSQWEGEIMKHFSTTLPPKVKMLTTKTEVPSAKTLATNFDV